MSFPASTDMMVDLPTPCGPITPTTRKSVWSWSICQQNYSLKLLSSQENSVFNFLYKLSCRDPSQLSC